MKSIDLSFPITMHAVATASAVAQSSAIIVALKSVFFAGYPVFGSIVWEYFIPFST